MTYAKYTPCCPLLSGNQPTIGAAAKKAGSAHWLTHDDFRVLMLMSGLRVHWNSWWQRSHLISSVSQVGQEHTPATVQSAENSTHLTGCFQDGRGWGVRCRAVPNISYSGAIFKFSSYMCATTGLKFGFLIYVNVFSKELLS